MQNTGLRNPARNSAISLLIALVGVASVWSGIAEMNAAGYETLSSAAKIGIGFVAAVIGFAALFNFLRGVKFVNQIKRAEGEIARWTVPAAEFESFPRRRQTAQCARDGVPQRLQAAAHDAPSRRRDHLRRRRGVGGGHLFRSGDHRNVHVRRSANPA